VSRFLSSTGCRHDSLLLLRAPILPHSSLNSLGFVTRHIASVRLYDRYHARPQTQLRRSIYPPFIFR
jgi:hypothetical protein